MKPKERIWILVARKLAEEASDKELDELQQLLKENPDISCFVQLMMDLWNPSVPASISTGRSFEKRFQRIIHSRDLNAKNQNHFFN